MSVVVIGLNHRTAALDLLERLTVDARRLPKALHDLTARPNLSEAVVLSTCNRTEVYAVAERFHGGFSDIRDFFGELGGLTPAEFTDHLYCYHDDAASTHLFEVAAGLDSAVIGEHEILGQVGSAWDLAREEGTAGALLNLLFRHALEVGKRVRTETAIARGITSVSQAAVAIAQDRLAGLGDRRVLVIGGGTMGEQMASAAATAGAAEVVVASRTRATAEAAAQRAGGTAVLLSEMGAPLAAADVLLSSTSAPGLLVGHDEVEAAMRAREGRPLLIIDVAVPRDVDPGVADLPGVTYLDMDDVRRFVDDQTSGRVREAAKAKVVVAEELDRYHAVASAREVAPLVAALHGRAEAIRLAEMDRVAGRLATLGPREREAVEALTRAVIAKVLHEPTVRLKDAAATSRGERLADSLRDLFDL